jgi:cysteine protease, calpain family
VTGYFESLINDVPGNADELATLAIQWDAYGIACNDYADDVAHSARTAREWEGAARRQFNASLTRQRNRYINLGGDCTTASSALSVYAGAVRAGQSYIENLRYQASKLDEEVDKAPIGAVARVKLIPAANALISAAHVRIESVKQAADTCAQDLARIVHIEPVQIDNGRATAAGQMGQLSQNDIAQIQKDLDALKDGTFDWRGMTQGQIADCYFLAPMAALAQTPEGQRKLASMIQPHYDEHGNVDGYLVRLPADPAHPDTSPANEVFVHSKYINGAMQDPDGYQTGNEPHVSVYSILEAAWGQTHPGGSNSFDNNPPGINFGYSTQAFSVFTGKSAVELPIDQAAGGYTDAERAKILLASQQHQPIVAGTKEAASVHATVDGKDTEIRLVEHHAYTVVSADANGVTLCNPHGMNYSSDGNAPATFTLSWEDYEAHYGSTVIGSL